MKKIYFLMLLSILSVSAFAQQDDTEKLLGEYQGEVQLITNGIGVKKNATIELVAQQDRDNYQLTLKGYKLGNSEFNKITIADVTISPDHQSYFVGIGQAFIYEKNTKGALCVISYKDQFDQSNIDNKEEISINILFRTQEGKQYIETKTIFTGKKKVATGINQIERTNDSSKPEIVYNLNGQRVDNPQHGIYIVNGKKVIFK
ncbi:hypothetical protein [Prevotella sp. HUN102]|uniref:hypothetical protein n=1 Tax=Prevotella sp. HUN102 TaxID=1392486 RepID=UPI00048FE17D|nr:hypothetical protein [Prevotella sp. HUN102]